MKKHGIGSRLISALLVLVLVLSVLPVNSRAVDLGTTRDGDTGLWEGTDINTENTISLPIKIYDYLNDGMLFDFAETAYEYEASTDGYWLRAEDITNPSTYFLTAGDFWGNDFTDQNIYFYVYQKEELRYLNDAAVYPNTTTMYYLNWPQGTSDKQISQFHDDDFKRNGAEQWAIPASEVQYMTLVYRSNYGYNGETMLFDFWDNTVGARSATASATIDNRGETWRYAIVNFEEAIDLSHEVSAVFCNNTASTNIGIAYVAYFSSEAEAKRFGEAALLYTGETYYETGNNFSYGLLNYSSNAFYDSDYISNDPKNLDNGDTTITYADVGDSETSQYTGKKYRTADDASEDYKLGLKYTKDDGTQELYSLFTEIYSGYATIGMVEGELSEDGYPVYKQETVEYLATLLDQTLRITKDEDSAYGYKNYTFVKGTPHKRYYSEQFGERDLAQWLRQRCASNEDLGYEETLKKSANLIGKWEDVSPYIETYTDAAYFLLNNLFVANSYNTPQNDYSYLVLSEATNSQGKQVFVFDAGFTTDTHTGNPESAVVYDEKMDSISNSTGLYKTGYCYSSKYNEETEKYIDLYTTKMPFLPIHTGATGTPYFLDSGATTPNEGGVGYAGNNYNYALVSEGEFIYNAADELFFQFEGDDDVYLFIDNKLVLDIGAAHGITKVRTNLNDYADTFGWVDGKAYSFRFFYLERHGVGANMRIETNIPVTDPQMKTEKMAWQDGVQLNDGAIINPKEPVEYGFSIENTSSATLFNMTFEDNDIGVKLRYTDKVNTDDSVQGGLIIGGTKNGVTVMDKNGGELGYEDLVATITHPNYAPITVRFEDEEDLGGFLREVYIDQDLIVEGTITKPGGGLFTDAKITIRGIYYKLTTDQAEDGTFLNTVYTHATSYGRPLSGKDDMRVYTPSELVYYQWAGKELHVDLDKFIADAIEAAKDGTPLSTAGTLTGTELKLTNSYGNEIPSSDVSIGANNMLNIHFTEVGSHLFYVRVTANELEEPVTVAVIANVADVKDSVFVLDYGLKAELNKPNNDNDGLLTTDLFKNDYLNIPGYDTKYSIIAMGAKVDDGYDPNEIEFEKAENEKKVVRTFGTFELGEASNFTYTPDTFMEGIDQVDIAMNVYANKDGFTPSNIDNPLDINNEVEMIKSVSVLPANVVYYEDDFPAIKYVTEGNFNSASVKNEFKPAGENEGSDKLTQSTDQSEEYGHDKNAYHNKGNDKYSGNSLKEVTIWDNNTVAYFTFKGTGFELISRTNATDSASLVVKIYSGIAVDEENRKITDGAKPIKTIPVITEFDNDTEGGSECIYQVPVIRVNDLDLDEEGKAATYTVVISGVPAHDYPDNYDGSYEPPIKETTLYIDGLRIFQPVKGDSAEDLYDADEKDAQFFELRKLITENPTVFVGSYTESKGLNMSNQLTTWTEKSFREDPMKVTSNAVGSINEYLLRGPNNEVYLTGTYGKEALIFYVKETGTGAHSLQIALRALSESEFFAGIKPSDKEPVDKATVSYGICEVTTTTTDNEDGTTNTTVTTKYDWETLVADMSSSTEQYFTINYKDAPYIDGLGYQIAIRVESGLVSFSSLKLVGLEMKEFKDFNASDYVFNPDDGKWYIDDGSGTFKENNLVDTASIPDFGAIATQLNTPYVPETEEPVEPEAPKPIKPTKPTTPFESIEIIGGDYMSRLEQFKKMLRWINVWLGR